MIAGKRPDDIRKRLEAAREAGFSLCQLNLLQTGFTRADLAAITDMMDELSIRPLAIGCYCNPIRPEDPGLMGAARSDLELLLLSMDMIGARRLVLWSGTHGHTAFEECEMNASQESMSSLNRFITDIVRSTRARRYELIIEPFPMHTLGTVERIEQFHIGLDPIIRDKVRYVVDAPAMITEETYPERDKQARSICRAIGEAAGVFHLRDIIMPPDGEKAFPPPGEGTLDYPAYLEAIFRYAPPETPAILRNVPPDQYAVARDYLLRQSDRWELA